VDKSVVSDAGGNSPFLVEATLLLDASFTGVATPVAIFVLALDCLNRQLWLPVSTGCGRYASKALHDYHGDQPKKDPLDDH
jgi:hypothetical protein